MRRALYCILAALLLTALPAAAENDGDCVYTLLDESGRALTQRAGRMFEGDEYISGSDLLYQIVSVDDSAQTATARCLGEASPDRAALAAFSAGAEGDEGTSSGGVKLICMYSTHSDESYVPTDGDSSKIEDAGIYDVGNALKENLEALGIQVEYSEETFHPHDAGAYDRSKSTAEDFVKEQPDALFDIHRDATPADAYETTVDGEESSMVRLFVGRSNPNGDANKAFAQQLKRVADDAYPGLIKDIYIGKGNYNQELYSHALLLEIGTHEIDKELAVTATQYLAQAVHDTLYGESAQAEETGKAQSGAATRGILWAIGLAVLGAILYALISTGTLSGMWNRLKRGTSEITGGMIGKKPKK